MVISTMLRNTKETGYPLSIRQWGLFTENVYELGLSDGAMVASTAFCLPMHRMYSRNDGILRWTKLGMAIQSVFQAAWLAFWVE
jgi:sterol O-acyltransferase